jgi:putative Mn2+ efflux pump MntP
MSMDASLHQSVKATLQTQILRSTAHRLIFGAIETLTPLVGWGLGMLASQFVLEWNHWIAFILLMFLGGRMVLEGFRARRMTQGSAASPRFLVVGHYRDCDQS